MIELAAVAAEEMEHFARVVALLYARGGKLEPIARNPYAEGLLAATGTAGGDALLNRLLVSSLIEARSLERFRLLAEHLADPELAALYRSLIASEAAHHALFLRLARRHYAAERVGDRLAALARVEAEILRALPFGVRMHSGNCVPQPTPAERLRFDPPIPGRSSPRAAIPGRSSSNG